MATSIVYTDQSPPEDGSALAAENLNTAVVAQAHLIKGGVLSNTATGSSSSSVPGLDLPMPETAAVVVVPNALDPSVPPQPIYVLVAAQAVPCAFNSDNYIDLYATEDGPTSTGSYHVWTVANPPGGPAPAQDSGTLRLCKVTMGASGITAVTQLATPSPVNQTMVQVDAVEAATWDTLGVTSTLLNNLDRIRYQLGAIYARVPGGGEWITAGTLEAWDTSLPGALQPMVPWSTRGIVNGVAELDQNARVPVGELPFGAVFTEPSRFSNGTFADPCPLQTVALKVSGGECVDTLTASAISTGSLSTPAGGTISGAHVVGTVDVNTPTLYVDDVYPHTAGAGCSRTITVHGANFNVADCQLQGASFYTPGAGTVVGHAQVGSLGVNGAATVGSSLGVSGVAVFGSTTNSPGTLTYGPVTIRDGTAGNPSSLKIERLPGGYTGSNADLMVEGTAVVQSSVTVHDLTVTTDLLVEGTFLGPINVDGDLTLTVGSIGNGSLRLRRLIYDQGPSPTYTAFYSASGASLGGTPCVTNRDNYGFLDYATGSATANGDQFQVVFGSTNHAAHPGVFLMMTTQGCGGATRHVPTPADLGNVYISSSDSTQFTVAFSQPPPTGVTYRFVYHVVE